MKLWRLTRAPYLALDGSGPEKHGARWTSPGHRIVNFASEPGLAVLVVLRYLLRDLQGVDEDYVLGWTETTHQLHRLPYTTDAQEKRALGDAWITRCEHLFAAVQSAVLPEADIIMMNCAHPLAGTIAPLVTRPFSFAQTMALPALDAPTRIIP